MVAVAGNFMRDIMLISMRTCDFVRVLWEWRVNSLLLC